jgi:hypothetical protein
VFFFRAGAFVLQVAKYCFSRSMGSWFPSKLRALAAPMRELLRVLGVDPHAGASQSKRVTIFGQVTAHGQQGKRCEDFATVIAERRTCPAALSHRNIPWVPTCTPRVNMSNSPTKIHATVAIDNNGTSKKNAPMLPRNRAPEKANRKRVILALVEQA